MKEELNVERLIDLLERQQIIIDTLWLYVNNEDKTEIIADIADVIFKEIIKKEKKK